MPALAPLVPFALVAALSVPVLCPPENAQPAAHQTALHPVPAIAESRIDVVFVLDTTGSMGGLIEGAKQKIWSIANAIATAEPRPAIRMGLVAYRDRGDEYITRLTPLTDDLDAVYADLMAFNAAGGGDAPESVNQALHEAVTHFDWSSPGDGALRLIYLVGDCPPHMDYPDDVKYHNSCELAARRGIIINTVQCGHYAETTPIWQEIARLAEGAFFQIEQSGGVVAVATPFDAELAQLTLRLEATVVPYGSRDQIAEQAHRQRRNEQFAADAPAEALASRAAYKAGPAAGSSLTGGQELVQDVADKKVDLAKLPDDQLPEPMRGMSAEQRREYVAAKAQERAQLQQRIQGLSRDRQAHITEQLAAAGAKNDGFDAAVVRSLRAQAARVGIAYPAQGE